MNCCVDGCERRATHRLWWGPVCDHHLTDSQRIEYEGSQRRQWEDSNPDSPMPEWEKSKGLQEAEQDAREELIEIACPWMAIRKRKREAALIRQVEDSVTETQDDSAALASETE